MQQLDLKLTGCSDHKEEETEEQINDIEDRIMENNEAEQKMERKYQITKVDLENSVTPSNITFFLIAEVPEEEEREKGAKVDLRKLQLKSSPNLEKEIDIQIQETQRTHIKIK